jgi:hypothetical protein
MSLHFNAGRLKRNHPMTRLRFSRWLAVLTLAIALAPSAASVLEADTLSISGTFHMDQLTGTVGVDLAEVFAHNNENTWSLTLFGITQFQSYEYIYDSIREEEHFITRVHAASFDFGFVGPDADVLNDVISQQLTRSSLGDDLFLELRNIYSYGGLYPGSASWDLGLLPLDDTAGVSFFAGAGYGTLTGFWFPAEYYYGYPYGCPLIVPQTITAHRTSIRDSRPESSGSLVSIDDFADIEVPILVLPGDYNHDGTVDAADYVVWRKTDGTPAGYTTWRAHFGQTAGSGSGASLNAVVPEPAMSVLLMLAAAGWCLRRGRAAEKVPSSRWRLKLSIIDPF